MFLASVTWDRLKALELAGRTASAGDTMFYDDSDDNNSGVQQRYINVYVFNTSTGYHSYMKKLTTSDDIAEFVATYETNATAVVDYDDAVAQAIGV